MADVNIEITLHGGEVEGPPHAYAPGSTVRGWVRLTPDGTIDTNRVVVRLQWHTEGRGDRNVGRAGEVEVATGPVSMELVQPFTLTVPHEPWSYAGHFINIIWAVLVVADVRHGRDIRHEERIVVAPRGQPVGPPPTPTPETAPYGPTYGASPAATSSRHALWIIGIVVAGIAGLCGLAIAIGLATMNGQPASTPIVEQPTEHQPLQATTPTAVAATTAGVPTRPAPSRPAPATIADGTWTVDVEVSAGTYRTGKAGSDCFWEIRKSGTDGSNLSDIIDNQLGGGQWTVTLSTGQDFETDQCGTWTKIG
jgi:hypothetical protein